MKEFDLRKEKEREYEFTDIHGNVIVYKIDSPVKLVLSNSGTSHRIVDSKGIIHLVPSPSKYGCILRWTPRNKEEPIQF